MTKKLGIKDYLKDNFNLYLDKWVLANILSDRKYLEWKFKRCVGYPLNLDNPRTYNEKLQWLKLNNIHPEYSKLVDKIEAKQYVASVVGSRYIIPTISVWDDVSEIEWEKLPEQFVIKVSNDSGGIVVCKDKATLDIAEATSKLSKNLRRSYYKYNKEYPYRYVTPRILAEEYKEDESGGLLDYKIFCFDGEPKLLFVASDRQSRTEETKFDFFDLEWNHLPIINGHPNSGKTIEKPENFIEMLEIASKLSKGMRHVRVDLYNIGGQVYFGEMTFFHWSGLVPIQPYEWDVKMGDYLIL